MLPSLKPSPSRPTLMTRLFMSFTCGKYPKLHSITNSLTDFNRPFADAVHAGLGSIMCSYNRANNSQACQNSKLLNGLLKGELGFQGFVVSDWGAQHSGMASALA